MSEDDVIPARRRFIQRTLGVVGYIVLAVAVIPVVAVACFWVRRFLALADEPGIAAR